MRMPIHDIKWNGLYGKNSDKVYVPTHAQLLLQFTHELKYNKRNEGLMAKLRKLQDGTRCILEE